MVCASGDDLGRTVSSLSIPLGAPGSIMTAFTTFDSARMRRARVAVSLAFFAFGTQLGLWFAHIPEVVTGLIGAVLIGLAFWSSVRWNKANPDGEPEDALA